jgi:hypothetical protein
VICPVFHLISFAFYSLDLNLLVVIKAHQRRSPSFACAIFCYQNNALGVKPRRPIHRRSFASLKLKFNQPKPVKLSLKLVISQEAPSTFFPNFHAFVRGAPSYHLSQPFSAPNLRIFYWCHI